MSTVSTRLLLAAWVAVLAVGCGGKSPEDLLASAKARAAKSDHAGAVLELKSVLQQTPRSGEARYLLGVSLLEQGDAASALVELRRAEELNVAEEALAPKIARALLATGKYRELVETYSGKEQREPSAQAEVSTALAVAFSRLGQRVESEAAVADALRADPRYPWGLLIKARQLGSLGKVEEALALIDQAIVPSLPNGDAHLLRATILSLAKNDVEGAITAYKQAAMDRRVEVDARSSLIQIYLSQGKLAEGRAQLAELQKSHPSSLQTAYLDAMVAYASKDFARAESILDRLLRIAPEAPKLLVLGGAANLQRGALVAAETKLGKLVQTIENAPLARKLLAETYVHMGQPEKALASLRPLLDRNTPDGDALALAGRAHLQAGSLKDAEAAFSSALTLKSGDASLRTALALASLARGNADAAFVELQDIAAKDTGTTADIALISAHMRRREYDKALAAIAQVEAKLPNKVSTIHLRGVALLGKGDAAGARAAFETAGKIDPKFFPAVAWLATLDLQENKPDQARNRLEAAIKLDPKNISARMALFDRMLNERAKAAELLSFIEDAIKVSSDDPRPRVAKISLLLHMNDPKAAALAAQNAMASLPMQPAVLDAAGRALALAGDEQQAMLTFNRLANVSPRSALPYLRLADLHAKRGDQGAVSSTLRRAFEAEPTSVELHRRLLDQGKKTRDFGPAIAAAKHLQRMLPDSTVGYMLEGDAESERQSWPRALAAYRAALSKSAPSGQPQKRVYATLRASGDSAGAGRFAADWIAKYPRDLDFVRFAAGDAVLRRDFATAERFYRMELASEPKSAAAMNNLAWAMAEQGLAGAVDMAERALALAPAAPPFLDTLAKALASEGKYERAVEVQRRAVAAMPSRQQYRVNLIRLYIKAGMKADAAAELAALGATKNAEQQPIANMLAELRKELER